MAKSKEDFFADEEAALAYEDGTYVSWGSCAACGDPAYDCECGDPMPSDVEDEIDRKAELMTIGRL